MKVKLDETNDRLAFCEAFSNPANKLKKDRDSMNVTMSKFSEYRRSGKVWHSPPFYYGEGYKMCLAVHANGMGEGAGTHVSVEMLQLRGEYDGQLKCTTKCDYEHYQYYGDGYWYTFACTLDLHKHTAANERVQIDCQVKFCRLNHEKILHMVNGCLTLEVKRENHLLTVEIV